VRLNGNTGETDVASNASVLTLHNREFGSNVTDRSHTQPEKQPGPITSTDDGIIMAVNPLFENAPRLICVNCEFDSIVTDTSDLQKQKQPDSIISTDEGIIMAVNPL
jgi:hypothetical protein